LSFLCLSVVVLFVFLKINIQRSVIFLISISCANRGSFCFTLEKRRFAGGRIYKNVILRVDFTNSVHSVLFRCGKCLPPFEQDSTGFHENIFTADLFFAKSGL
jgi:hypothetical protein